ncbi:hypothetical protein, partial [Cryobacterium sp. TMS1-13-1]|uniref:hypothetical protein n=1 Tax=Cryobacterium sp. TMS1-13-1 TaxID=1259220 RepID=UPI0035145702
AHIPAHAHREDQLASSGYGSRAKVTRNGLTRYGSDCRDILIQRGDAPDLAALGMLARRLADGTAPAADNVDLSVYDIFTTPGTTIDIDIDTFTIVNTVTGEIA